MAGRIIGIDFGTKRVGLAVSDPLAMFAQPLGTYAPGRAVEIIGEMNAKERIDCFVVGWPVDPDGREGVSARRVTAFSNRLRNKFPEASVIEWNEEYTSEAAREMIASGSKPSMRHERRGRLDTAAAGILLQEYLDQMRR